MNSVQLNKVVSSYGQLQSPGYAIMINGAWGCGKTHFIKSHFHEQSELKMLYVSLYGVDSISRIDDEIFSSMIGAEGVSEGEIKKAGDFIGRLFGIVGGKAEGSAMGALASTMGDAIKNRALKNIGNNTILVFDDLERAELSFKQCLSKINEYVEHLGFKVIVLCDESKISDEKYLEYKEKVILYTNHLEQTAEDIADICFTQFKQLESPHTEFFKHELVNTIKQFSLYNIRTIKHGIDCFIQVVKKLYKLNFQFKDDKIIGELIFPCIGFATGYKDYSVPIDDLEKTSTNYVNQSVTYHMKKDDSKGTVELTNWEKFYDSILSKTMKQMEFQSIFELVCKGHLSEEKLKKDLDKWNVKEYGPDYPIITFRLDEEISEERFNENILCALNLLKDEKYRFYSTEDLYTFCRTFLFLYEKNAFKYEGDFNKDIKEFAEVVVSNCLNHTEPSAFGMKDTDGDVLNQIFSMLNEKSDALGKAKSQSSAQIELIESIKIGDTMTLEKISNYSSIEIFTFPFTQEILKEIPSLSHVKLRVLGIFLSERYRSAIFSDYLASEIDSLIKLANGIKQIFEKTPNSLKKLQLTVVLKTSEDIANKGNLYKKKQEDKSPNINTL